MLEPLERRIRLLRQKLSRTEWIVRLIGLERELPADSTANSRRLGYTPGLVLLQIDGLSNAELQRALDSNRMPFLARLLRDEHYGRLPMYSGLPSSTPAVQGELFYGIKGVVPAFGFYNRKLNQIDRMWYPETAQRVQSDLEKQGDGLLSKGSAYCNIYTGGASEPHFCAASMGWFKVLSGMKPSHWLLVLLLNLPIFIRFLFLASVEFLLAIVDVIRGQLSGYSFLPEIKFIVARVGVSILLRDLCTMSAKLDMARGLPIIHLNFLGYDEQSHRRGPGSRFAHWTLKGIDGSIKALWKAAQLTSGRQYELWIYSDHGQESTTPYIRLAGYPIEEAVSRAVSVATGAESSEISEIVVSGRAVPHRDSELATRRAKSIMKGFTTSAKETDNPQKFSQRTLADAQTVQANSDSGLTVVAQGPVGHVYFNNTTALPDLPSTCQTLVQDHHVPACIVRSATHENQLDAYTKDGVFRLPEEIQRVTGDSHPYVSEVKQDLLRLGLNENAGDIVLLGWAKGTAAISFAHENGAHAGCGPHETDAFALIPEDVVHTEEVNYLRPAQLRDLACDHAGLRGNTEYQTAASSISRSSTLSGNPVRGDKLKVMTYNVHGCIGMDGIVAPERIARVISRIKPDIVCLQELDVGRGRTHSRDQAALIAGMLGMNFSFVASLREGNGSYGNAILSRYPIDETKTIILPQAVSGNNEPRSAQWVRIEWGNVHIDLLNTHLGLDRAERQRHAELLSGDDWLGDKGFTQRGIMCGDLNSLPKSAVLKTLNQRLRNTHDETPGEQPTNTFGSRAPVVRIDHILVGSDWAVGQQHIPRDELTRVASDHLPLMVELQPSP